ncbi:MAG: hypothetical protein ACI31F_04645 [Muribaculaceae bacterium]
MPQALQACILALSGFTWDAVACHSTTGGDILALSEFTWDAVACHSTTGGDILALSEFTWDAVACHSTTGGDILALSGFTWRARHYRWEAGFAVFFYSSVFARGEGTE